MSALTRMALPVPAIGTAIGDAGDAYVASLDISVIVDGVQITTMTGTAFEWFMMSLRLRHLAFHPRTRAFVPGEMKAPALAKYIGQNWSALDGAVSEVPDMLDQATAIESACRSAVTFSWAQAN